GSDVYYHFPGKTIVQAAFDFVDIWVEAGIPPAAILKAMTTNIAELLEIADERGSIKPGQYADIIATASNPLEDIAALKEVKFVMKEGVVVKRYDASDAN
ncbi:amidohydrolase family protein, partial [candidate division KSB1 bacterium]|nr:amidohydrolase family protein [candidate division KSB1 bacterium]